MVGEGTHESYGTIPPSVSEPREGEAEQEVMTTGSMQSYDDILDEGKCPWCPDYEGEYPERHARRAHPERWRDYQEE